MYQWMSLTVNLFLIKNFNQDTNIHQEQVFVYIHLARGLHHKIICEFVNHTKTLTSDVFVSGK